MQLRVTIPALIHGEHTILHDKYFRERSSPSCAFLDLEPIDGKIMVMHARIADTLCDATDLIGLI